MGLCLAVGGIAGAYLIPVLTAGKIELSSYLGYFGLVVFIIAVAFCIHDTTERGQAKKKSAKAAAKAFEEANIKKGGEAATIDHKARGFRSPNGDLPKSPLPFMA